MDGVPPAGGEVGQGTGFLVTPGLLPEGIRDRLPPQAEAAVALTAVLMGVVGSHGYARVQPPLIEYEESLAGRLGAGSGRQAQRLRFVDPVTQRTLAVRSDITGQVGRIAATRLAHLPRPLRLGYAGPVLRVKGSQLTPERELLQAGAELIGSDTVAAALDVLGVAVEALAATGLTGLSIDLTLPDIVPTLASEIMPEDRIERLQALLDMKDAGALTAEGFGSWLPLLGVPGPVGEALPRLRAFDHAGLLATRLDGIAAVAAALGDRVRLTLDPTERHGFEYQSWLGFSLFADGVHGEVGRGGSYRVMHDTGDEAAVGFSLYIDGLVEAGLGVTERRRVALPFGTAGEVAARLRAAGWTTVAALDADAMPGDCGFVWNGSAAVPCPEDLK